MKIHFVQLILKKLMNKAWTIVKRVMPYTPFDRHIERVV